MNDITVITSPDMLYNNAFGILLVCPSVNIRNVIHDMLVDSNIPINIFLYDEYTDDIEWLLIAAKQAEVIILDIDNINHPTQNFVSYLLGANNTFYLTSDNIIPYNLINKNRIYDLKWLENIVYNKRGKDE